jgi:addiction module HigA family antidote
MLRDSSQASVGSYIRESVLPQGMSVKEAAERLGVGRPALSNLLNGRASLSSEMAIRLEKAFGANQETLLSLQAQVDDQTRRKEQRRVPVGAYVPNFLSIKAREIERWVSANIDARQHLSVLLRRLVNSTGHDLIKVDFPGYDDAESKGPDGVLESPSATPWIPEGTSFWEFGTNQTPKKKAEDDYSARTASTPAAVRLGSEFVFVTPQKWSGKKDWAATKTRATEWKAVRALDSSDLEQWLEQSIPAQMWLAERLDLPTTGFETLERSWHRWRTGSEPPMTEAIFESSISSHRGALQDWLARPPSRPFVLTADSKDESLAFLACLLGGATGRARDLAVVFHDPQALRKIADSAAKFIPISCTDEVAREFAPLYRRLHCIVVRPRNAVESAPDIALDLLSDGAFRKALDAMGIPQHDVERLALESGRSPTVLRRRLSELSAIRMPAWASSPADSRALVPMTLVGAWHSTSRADREVLALLAASPYEDIERELARLLQTDDSPVWSTAQYRGVVSKLDALFGTAKFVTERDLTEFLVVAEYVLSESDPALELPADKRWQAGIYGKVRDHSAALRRGICESLVLLAVHGNFLFRKRLGIEVDANVAALIQRLLTPLTLERLLSHQEDLPRYAEAAPGVLLSILEEDIQRPAPVVLGLLKPVGAGIFERCPRTGLLWALECLGWKPENLPRVSRLLAQLAQTKIDDNWANKPIASLSAIFCSWLPQTAASLEDREGALDLLAHSHPEIAWKICLEQLGVGPQLGHPSYRPEWRSDASGAGHGVSEEERVAFARKALDIALAWPRHSEESLGDLVQRVDAVPEDDADRIWDLVDSWSSREADDALKATLRERIRRFALTSRGLRRGLAAEIRNRAREAYARLEPLEPAIRHTWLFANSWVDESAEELESETLDLRKREERIEDLRRKAMAEVWAAKGFAGVECLLAGSGAPHIVGWYSAHCVPEAEAKTFVSRLLAHQGLEETKVSEYLRGFLASSTAESRAGLALALRAEVSADRFTWLLRCAPFSQETWTQLERFGEGVRLDYWRSVQPQLSRFAEAEVNELADRLLEVDRPLAAFSAVRFDLGKLETSRLKRLLSAIGTGSPPESAHYGVNAHDIDEALSALDGRAGVSSEEMAQLEFKFIDALGDSARGIPNLERALSDTPSLFAQAVALTYRRDDGREDPSYLNIEDPERRKAIASSAHQLLRAARRIPGTERHESVDAGKLTAWINGVRAECSNLGRSEIGDHCIGALLAKGPAGQDGQWPCPPICEALEAVGSRDLGRGFIVATRNLRGVHWRKPGGDQERELAAKYRAWASSVSFSYPYVSRLLLGIAASYEHDGERQDADEEVRKRLGR